MVWDSETTQADRRGHTKQDYYWAAQTETGWPVLDSIDSGAACDPERSSQQVFKQDSKISGIVVNRYRM